MKLEVDVLLMIAGVVDRHRKELGTPPTGILDVECEDGLCRICCSWVKHCVCNTPPHAASFVPIERIDNSGPHGFSTV